MLQQLSQDKYQDFSPKKKDRSLILWLFVLTTLISLVFWINGGGLDFRLPSFTLALPSWFSKTYVFEKKEPQKESLEPQIIKLLEGKKGSYGLWFKNLKTGETLGLNENQVFQAASVNKVPIMIAFYQAIEAGVLREDQVYELKAKDKQEGTGSMQASAPGTQYSYKELIRLCGIESDNTAAHVLLNLIDYQRIKKLLEDNNLKNISLPDNLTTPAESGRLFELVFQGKLLKKENQKEFFDFLTDTFFEERIPAGVPEEIKVAHKIGTNVGIYDDCGVVFGETPYVLCILSNEVVESEAKEILPEISHLVWEFVGQ